jgi:hypothetical protein
MIGKGLQHAETSRPLCYRKVRASYKYLSLFCSCHSQDSYRRCPVVVPVDPKVTSHLTMNKSVSAVVVNIKNTHSSTTLYTSSMAPFAGRTLLFVCLYTLLLVGLATCDEATCDADGTCAATTDDALNDEDHSRSYGIQQTTASDEVEQGLAMQQRLLKVDDYMQNTVFVEERYTTVRDECQNREALCVFWACT